MLIRTACDVADDLPVLCRRLVPGASEHGGDKLWLSVSGPFRFGARSGRHEAAKNSYTSAGSTGETMRFLFHEFLREQVRFGCYAARAEPTDGCTRSPRGRAPYKRDVRHQLNAAPHPGRGS